MTDWRPHRDENQMTDAKRDPTERFSDRVEDYVKYRPGYPKAILHLLRQEAGLTQDSVVADIGSGTGKLATIFLDAGNRVYAVEPNDEMREAGESLLAAYPNVISLKGTAEATNLPTQSVDIVAAGQAFHWFDAEAARVELARVLKQNGFVILVWNDWGGEMSPFVAAYDRLLQQYGLDYKSVRHRNVSGDDNIRGFFGGPVSKHHFGNSQLFDFAGLRGRLLSSSYTPTSSHPNYKPMINELRKVFDRFQEGGRVRFQYDTVVYLGQLA